MIELSTIRDLVAIFGVIAGFSYYVLTVRANKKNQELMLKSQELSRQAQEQQLETRQAQLFMQIFSRIYEERNILNAIELLKSEWKDYDDWYSQYGLVNPEGYAKFNSRAIFYEGIGVLVKRGLIDASLVDDLISSHTLRFWSKIQDVVYEYRKRTGDNDYCEWVEYLADEVKKLRDEREKQRKG